MALFRYWNACQRLQFQAKIKFDLVKECKLVGYSHNGCTYDIKEIDVGYEIQAHSSSPQLYSLFHQGKWFGIVNSSLLFTPIMGFLIPSRKSIGIRNASSKIIPTMGNYFSLIKIILTKKNKPCKGFPKEKIISN